jgi:hypothetical protein
MDREIHPKTKKAQTGWDSQTPAVSIIASLPKCELKIHVRVVGKRRSARPWDLSGFEAF